MGDGGLDVTVVVGLPRDLILNQPATVHTATVQALPHHSVPALAYTGAPVAALLLLASLLLAGGALLLAGTRRTR